MHHKAFLNNVTSCLAYPWDHARSTLSKNVFTIKSAAGLCGHLPRTPENDIAGAA